LDHRLDRQRQLRLVLGAIWLLDGLLQYQPFMFGKGFPQMLSATAQGNPAPVARPIIWSATLTGQHLALANATFATIQVAIGLGIAFRPTVKPALLASVGWSLAVWWLGEGLGGILTGNGSLLAGAPGAVLFYALLSVLLWPADRGNNEGFPAAQAVGQRAAQAIWLGLWLAMAAFALLPGSVAPHSLSDSIAEMAPGQPGWLAWIDTRAANAIGGHGLAAEIVLAVVLAAIAVAIYRYPRMAVSAALAVAVITWLAEGTGGLLTGMATDPDSGPLLALLALAYWPGTQRWRAPERWRAPRAWRRAGTQATAVSR
jgi:hypothetical protein